MRFGETKTKNNILNSSPQLTAMLIKARRLGCSKGQILNFLSFGYIPLPRGLEFHSAAREVDVVEGQALVGYGGPRGEAKTHAVICQVVFDDCVRVSGLKCLYLRKIKASAREQIDDLIVKVIGRRPKGGAVDVGDGGRLVIGGYKDKNQLAAIIGIEYDIIIVEDATTLSESDINEIRGSLRTARSDWKPRLYMPTNPGGIGHSWYKKLFWDKWITGKQTNTRFVHARPGDNPFIDKGYREYLDSLTGWLRLAWRDGDFSINAGQYFNTFNYEHHTFKLSELAIPQYGGTWWLAMDYGYSHWNVTGLAYMNDNNVYIVDMHIARKQLPEHNARGINRMLTKFRNPHLTAMVAGHDIFAQRGTKLTIAQEYSNYGLPFQRAKIDRINGWRRVAMMLGNPAPIDDELFTPARLFIEKSLVRLIECIPELQHNPNNMEDVLKVDSDPNTGEGGDDPGDMLRYLLMATPGVNSQVWKYSKQ